MIGQRNPATVGQGMAFRSIALVQLAPREGGPRGVPNSLTWYEEQVRRPDLVDPIIGMRASIENGGRGTFQASSKRSEHNIYNAVPRIVVAWPASYTMRSPMTPRVISSPIPVGAIS